MLPETENLNNDLEQEILTSNEEEQKDVKYYIMKVLKFIWKVIKKIVSFIFLFIGLFLKSVGEDMQHHKGR